MRRDRKLPGVARAEHRAGEGEGEELLHPSPAQACASGSAAASGGHGLRHGVPRRRRASRRPAADSQGGGGDPLQRRPRQGAVRDGDLCHGCEHAGTDGGFQWHQEARWPELPRSLARRVHPDGGPSWSTRPRLGRKRSHLRLGGGSARRQSQGNADRPSDEVGKPFPPALRNDFEPASGGGSQRRGHDPPQLLRVRDAARPGLEGLAGPQGCRPRRC
mmetsp:Transcript_16843/g.64134  ORF Transcript_16843/g.64134 Transcript_16843/m.64134 type:complete len:218 (+) Transcript_16843:2445-3098(+)